MLCSLTHNPSERNFKDDRGTDLTGTFYESLRSMLSAAVGSQIPFCKSTSSLSILNGNYFSSKIVEL